MVIFFCGDNVEDLVGIVAIEKNGLINDAIIKNCDNSIECSMMWKFFRIYFKNERVKC